MSSRPAKTDPGSSSSSARRLRYSALSTDPLHILIFLFPLVLFYEATLVFADHGGVADSVAAHEMINRFFQAFGDAALYLPGVVLIGILLVMKLARRDAWTVRLPVIPLMGVESVVWAIPLLVIAALLSTAPAVQAASAGDDLARVSLTGRVALSIGAGLYEEMLFRLLMVTVAAMLLRNLARLSDTWAAGLAIALAAVAFTFYHQPGSPGTMAARRLLYFVAGCFLGLVYVLRGFGIVVGAHAVYDLFVLIAFHTSATPDSGE